MSGDQYCDTGTCECCVLQLVREVKEFEQHQSRGTHCRDWRRRAGDKEWRLLLTETRAEKELWHHTWIDGWFYSMAQLVVQAIASHRITIKE
jgi:hypothetical protein